MAYNNNYNNYSNRSQGNSSFKPQPKPMPMIIKHEATAVPENYAVKAEEVMSGFVEIGERGKQQIRKISSSKLRNLFGAYTEMYNVIRREGTKLTEEQKTALTSARIRLIYESGREPDVKEFVEKAHLIDYLLWIEDSPERFIRFYHYFEALVAYHRYYGGKEK